MPLGGIGLGLPFAGGSSGWLPTELGSGVRLWLRPEDLPNANLVKHSNVFSSWAALTSITVTPNQEDPHGGSGASLLTPDGTTRYAGSGGLDAIENDIQHTMQLWWKRGPGHNGTSGSRIWNRFWQGGSGTTQQVPPATWELLTHTNTAGAAEAGGDIRIYPDYQTGTQSILVYHCQREVGPTATRYKENGATIGGLIASWPDAGPHGNDHAQSTQASMPLVQADVLDGYSGARFDAVDDRLRLTPQSLTQPFSVYTVSIADAGDNGPHFLYSIDGGSQIYMADYFQGARIYAGSLIGEIQKYSGGDPILMRGIFNGASSSVYINDVEITTGDAGANNPSARVSTIGASASGGGNGLLGFYIEALVVERAVTGLEDSKIMTYLANKYPSLGI